MPSAGAVLDTLSDPDPPDDALPQAHGLLAGSLDQIRIDLAGQRYRCEDSLITRLICAHRGTRKTGHRRSLQNRSTITIIQDVDSDSREDTLGRCEPRLE